jgi:hypothetical protein
LVKQGKSPCGVRDDILSALKDRASRAIGPKSGSCFFP